MIKLLTALEGRNAFGLNVFRHTRNPKAKRRYRLLAATTVLVIAVLIFYVGALSYGLVTLRLAKIVPAYLIMIASLIMLAFGLFRAGPTLFSQKGYNMLCSLPLPTRSIVLSRLLRMYLSDLGLGLMILMPGCAVMGWMTRPSVGFYLRGLAAALCVPVLPLAVSAVLGTVITAISSRMRRKVMVETALTIALVVSVLALSFGMTAVPEESFTMDRLFSLADTISGVIGHFYPPAAWLGGMMINGPAGVIALCALASLLVMAGLTALVTRVFHPVCRSLFANAARHDYRMGTLSSQNIAKALLNREFRRYFASSVYVTNTIVGPIMGAMLAAAVLIGGVETIEQAIPLPVDIRGLIPFALALPFTLMTTTSVSISMEGKQYWIVQSLPVSRKQLFDAKIGMNLYLMAPFYAIAEILLIIALKPAPLAFFWLMIIPALLCVFAAVIGITVNLRFGRMDWESEVAVVKQSASAALGGFAGPLMTLVCAVFTVLLPGNGTKLAVCAAVAGLTLFLYQRNNKAA